MTSVRGVEEFDETYAWKMGGRVRISLTDGAVLERTVHGQKGSMHDPLSAAELEAKFERLVAGLAEEGLSTRIRHALDQRQLLQPDEELLVFPAHFRVFDIGAGQAQEEP